MSTSRRGLVAVMRSAPTSESRLTRLRSLWPRSSSRIVFKVQAFRERRSARNIDMGGGTRKSLGAPAPEHGSLPAELHAARLARNRCQATRLWQHSAQLTCRPHQQQLHEFWGGPHQSSVPRRRYNANLHPPSQQTSWLLLSRPLSMQASVRHAIP
jgi:hypothetical protein